MDICQSLARSERSAVDIAAGLDVVCELLRNIQDNPENEKFRKVRKANKRIAVLLGREEEGLLRAAGFEDGDDGEFLTCPGGDPAADGDSVPAALPQVLRLCKAVHAVFGEHAAKATAEAGTPDEDLASLPVYQDPAVMQALEVALFDLAAVQSADEKPREKKRRKLKEEDAVQCDDRWRTVIASWLLDGGALENWLGESPQHRKIAHELCQLQDDSSKWYGDAARSYCERRRVQLLQLYGSAAEAASPAPSASSAAAVGPVEASPGPGSSPAARLGDSQSIFAQLRADFEKELCRMQEALFLYPVAPGGTPELFLEPAGPRVAASTGIEDSPCAASSAGGPGDDSECEPVAWLRPEHAVDVLFTVDIDDSL